MKKAKCAVVFFGLLCLAGCSSFNAWKTPLAPSVPTYKVKPMLEDVIALQNLKTRVIVYCAHGAYASAEMCARNYERAGFVRLTQIPSRTADNDFLKADTYPTRRWRKDDLVPRW